jgi:SRSO17 transposase
MADRLIAMIHDFAGLFNTRGDSGQRLAATYIKGLLSRMPGKNMERMADVMAEANQQDLQQFVSDSPWDDGPVWDQIASRANGRLGNHRDSMLVIDESAFAKQGKSSAGVARQHNGRLGKTDNCQVGVFSTLVRGTGATMIGARLFLPDEWTDSPERCKKAGIPEDGILAKTKIEQARELIEQALRQEVGFKLVAFDAFYGRDQGLLQSIHEKGLTFMADIPVDTLVWSSKPAGKTRPKKIAQSGAVRADALKLGKLESIHVRDGENGAVRVQAAAKRVWLWPGRAEAPLACWLIATEQTDGSRKFSLSNAPEKTKLNTLVKWQGQRFFIEQTFKTAKSHCGMADYQVRKYRGWHHHMALVGMALLFLLDEKHSAAVEMPQLSACDISEIIDWHFCTQPSREAVIETIARRHARRAKATASKKQVQRRAKRSIVLTK